MLISLAESHTHGSVNDIATCFRGSHLPPTFQPQRRQGRHRDCTIPSAQSIDHTCKLRYDTAAQLRTNKLLAS